MPPEKPAPVEPKNNDFLVSGFRSGITDEDIKAKLLQRGIKTINYVEVRNKESKKTWTSARISVSFQDSKLMLDPNFWESWVSVVPWIWKEKERVRTLQKSS